MGRQSRRRNLSKEELLQALKEAQVPVSSSQLNGLYELMANNECGNVHVDDFVAFCQQRRRALRQAFDDICKQGRRSCNDSNDTLGEQYFTAGHLRRAAARAGIALSEKDVSQIMQQLDLNRDGNVMFYGFVQWLPSIGATH